MTPANCSVQYFPAVDCKPTPAHVGVHRSPSRPRIGRRPDKRNINREDMPHGRLKLRPGRAFGRAMASGSGGHRSRWIASRLLNIDVLPGGVDRVTGPVSESVSDEAVSSQGSDWPVFNHHRSHD
ncbi:hypothetical protein F2P79_002450 [Pimephales promelas]|nr:hypothetical protein F2P79_002450 [Pimephales promelas]